MKVEDKKQISVNSDTVCDVKLVKVESGKTYIQMLYNTDQFISISAAINVNKPLGLGQTNYLYCYILFKLTLH